MIGLVERMTACAQAQGALRPDVGPAGVGPLMRLRVHVPASVPTGPAMSRVADILRDGLRPAGEQPGG